MKINNVLLIVFILLVREILVFIEMKKYFKILSFELDYTEKEKIILLEVLECIKYRI